MKKATSVSELLKRKADKMGKKQITVDTGDIVLQGELLSLPHVLSIVDEYDTTTKSGAMDMALELMYMTFPIFRSKEIQEQNEHSEPHEVILDMLNVQEIQKVMEQLNVHYGVVNDSELKK